jgi:hypothetical protein
MLPALPVTTPTLQQAVTAPLCTAHRRSTKPQVTAAYKEGLYQKTAGPWMEDITATLQPLPFNLSQVRPTLHRLFQLQIVARCLLV